MSAHAKESLIIIGRHEDEEGEQTILREMVRRIRNNGQLLIVTVASQEPEAMADAYREMIRKGRNVTPQTEQIATFPRRLLIADTGTGQMLRGPLEDLKKLVSAYRQGVLVKNARPGGPGS